MFSVRRSSGFAIRYRKCSTDKTWGFVIPTIKNFYNLIPSFSTFLQKDVFLYFSHSLAEYITGLISFPSSHPSSVRG